MNYITKWKYLKVTGDLLWGTDNLTTDDLVRAKRGGYDTIINLEEMTRYDPEKNEWIDIDGEKA